MQVAFKAASARRWAITIPGVIRWRIQLRRGELPDTSRARLFCTFNHVEMGLVVLIVFVVSFMARGFGLK